MEEQFFNSNSNNNKQCRNNIIFNSKRKMGIFRFYFSKIKIKTFKTIYKKTYDETLKRTEEKSLEITSSIKNFTANYFLKFVTELKKIAKYTLLYNGKSENNYTNIINRNSQFILNNNIQKKIINANINQLFTTPEFFKIYKETGQLNELGLPTDTSNLNYIKYYSQVFGEEKDKNKILKKLFKEHDELNYISYHYYGNNHTYDINSDHEKEELIKNILVIIKTIFIQRMITKKTRMDIIRFIIITNEDMFIYRHGRCDCVDPGLRLELYASWKRTPFI